MFRQLATWYEAENPAQSGAEPVFALHPLQLTRFLEQMWLMRTDPGSRPSPPIPAVLYGLEAASGIAGDLVGVVDDIFPTPWDPPEAADPGAIKVPFRHLMYAYLIENTRVFEIFRRVRVEFPQYSKDQLVLWIERFFKLWCRNQWKRERYAPSFHVDDENLDPKTWCRFPILSGGYERELEALREYAARA